MMSVQDDIKAHLEASRRLRDQIRSSPKAARQWLIRMGILTKDGKKLARRYR